MLNILPDDLKQAAAKYVAQTQREFADYYENIDKGIEHVPISGLAGRMGFEGIQRWGKEAWLEAVEEEARNVGFSFENPAP